MATLTCDCEIVPALEKSMTCGSSDEYTAMTSNINMTSPVKASLTAQLSFTKQTACAGDGADDSCIDRAESQQSTATNFSCDSLLSTSTITSTNGHGWDVQAILPDGSVADLETGAVIHFAHAKEFASSHQAKLVAKNNLRVRQASRKALAAREVETECVCSLDASGTLRGPIATSPVSSRAELLKALHRKRWGRRSSEVEQLLLCVGGDGRVRLILNLLKENSGAKVLSWKRMSCANSTSSDVLVIDQDGLVQDCQAASGDHAEDGGQAGWKPDILAVTPEGCVVSVDSSATPVLVHDNTMMNEAKEKAKAGVRRMREWESVAAANVAEARLEAEEVFSLDSNGLLRGPVAAAVHRWASFDANGVVRAPRFNDAAARRKLFCLKKRLRDRRGQREEEDVLPLCVDSDGKSCVYVPLSSKKKRSKHQRRAYREEVIRGDSVIVVDEAGLVHE